MCVDSTGDVNELTTGCSCGGQTCDN